MNSINTAMLKIAIESQSFSHSPYSQKKIGACIELTNGALYGGCNIENASFGGTVCAERVAIWKAYSENSSEVKLKSILVLSDELEPWPPCGLCRQIFSEFGSKDTEIWLANKSGMAKRYSLAEIFPLAFAPDHLKN